MPQRRASWAIRNSPRPPSSVAFARRRCGEVLESSATSQIRLLLSYSRRSLMGWAPYRMALVTSSLTISSAVKARWSRPQVSS